jgi:hypothetical protein
MHQRQVMRHLTAVAACKIPVVLVCVVWTAGDAASVFVFKQRHAAGQLLLL